MQMLQQAAQEHIPVQPSVLASRKDDTNTAIGETSSRPSVDELIQDVMEQDWYREQIVFRKTIDIREPQIGRSHPLNVIFVPGVY